MGIRMTIEQNTSVLAIIEAAIACETIGQAAQRLEVDDLPGLLVGRKTLQAAWDRGRFLRQLQELAEGPICQKVVAERLGFDERGFNGMLVGDPEAADIWRQGRHRFFLKAKTAIMAGAEQGKPHCLHTIEAIIRQESGASKAADPVDFARLTPSQMQTATGIHRQQILRWKAYGLSGNVDGTYSMAAFCTFLRKSSVGRTRSYRQRDKAIEKRIAVRVAAIVKEELARQSDTASGGQ